MARLKPVAPFHFQPFSKKQKKILTWWLPESVVSEYDGIIADGSIRSGKTICMGTSFFMWAMENFDGENFAICGKSITACRRNVVEPMKRVLTGRGYHYIDHHGEDAMLEVFHHGRVNRFYIFGGKDERSQDFIQGITLAGVFLDEVALMPQSFVNQATGRCSVEGSKFWFNCNPAGPSHWFKTEWLDKCEDLNLLHLHFVLDDNLSLSEKIKQRYRSMYSGVFYRRYILGEWCVAEGIIYPMYEKAQEDRWQPPEDEDGHALAVDYSVSIDYGTQNAFAALLWQKDAQGIWHATDEYRYSGRDTGRLKTDEEYADELDAWLNKALPEYAWRRKIMPDGGLELVVDPSAASFIATMRRRHRYRVRKAKNDVLDGIRDTATCLLTGKIKISRTLTGTVKEFGGYVWDDKPGVEDRPIKIEDHCMDSMRYHVATHRLVKPVEKYHSPFGGF